MSSYQEDEYAPDNWQVLAPNAGVSEPVAEVPAVEQEQVVAPDDRPLESNASAGRESEDLSDKEYNFRALRESIAEQKAEREAERRRYEQELFEMKYQLNQQMQSQKQPEKSALDGLDNSDLMTVEAYKKAQHEQQMRYQEELNTLRYENLENRARLQHSDYNEVMEKYSIPFLRENRDFARAFQAAENPAEFAYQLGRMQQGTQSAPQHVVETQARENAERIVQNARKPGTLSSARGGQPSLSKADYYASMSESDFAQFVQRNLEQV